MPDIQAVNLISRTQELISDIKSGGLVPEVESNSKEQDLLANDFTTVILTNKEALKNDDKKREGRFSKIYIIYKTFRALTDGLTSEWAEWALVRTIELIPKDKRTKTVKLIEEKLVNSIKEAAVQN